MALLDSEVARVKAELGYNLMSNGAAPWIDTVAIFEQVIQPYLGAGATTTSSTAVTAATTPTPVAITLASATGFAAGARVVVDVDSRQESATVQSITGAVITVLLSLAHAGTYPVTVEGGETIVREILRQISSTKTKMSETHGEGSLKTVDELEWYDTGGKTTFGSLADQLSYWREQLAAVLGIPSMWSRKRAAAQTCAVY